mgnify:CR=1 FL=1
MAITNAQQYKQLVNPPLDGKRPGYRGDAAARSTGAAQSGRADPGERGDPGEGANRGGFSAPTRGEPAFTSPDRFVEIDQDVINREKEYRDFIQAYNKKPPFVGPAASILRNIIPGNTKLRSQFINQKLQNERIKDFYENFSETSDLFKKANDVLNYDLGEVCFYGPQEKLNLSNFAQLGIFVSSIAFYNALQQGWNSSQEPFNEDNLLDLIGDLREINYSRGLGKDASKVTKYLNLFDIDSSSSKSAQTALNDPFSSALRIFNDYSDYELIREDEFDKLRAVAYKLTGFPSDKWNPGDVYIKLSPVDMESVEKTDATEWIKLTELFVNNWGDTDAPLVSVSLKQEKAQGGKAKSFLQKFQPEVIADGLPLTYQLTDEEMNYTDDQYDEAINKYKTKVNAINKGDFLFQVGDNPSKTEQKKFKLAAYKALDYLFTYFSDNLDSSPANALVKIVGAIKFTDI